MKIRHLLFAAALFPLAIQAEDVPKPANADDSLFPKGSKPLDDAVLRERISGHDFITHSWTSNVARYQFHANGNAWINLGQQSDKGPWRIEGSRICVDWKFGTPNCMEVRELDGKMYTRWGELQPN